MQQIQFLLTKNNYLCNNRLDKMKQQQIAINYFECSNTELTAAEQETVRKAIDAATKAYAPYSGFRVGAAALLENGEIIAAANQENAAYPSGMCAERNVLYYCKSVHPDLAITALVITALDADGNVQKVPVPPCGACRQVICETTDRNKKAFKLILHGLNHNLQWNNANDLLPLSFGPEHL